MAAMVYYHYAHKAENHPELWGIDDFLLKELQDIEVITQHLMAKLAEADGETLDNEQLRYKVLSTDYDEAELLQLFGDLCFSPIETGAALYAWYEDHGGDTPLNRRVAEEEREIKLAPHKWAIVGRGVCEVYAFRGEWRRVHPKGNKTFLGKLKDADLFDSQADAQRELQRRKALITEIEALIANGYIVLNPDKLSKEPSKVLERFLRELKS